MSRAEVEPLAGVDTARLFAALGDATRLGLVLRLSDGRARSIAQMGEGLTMSRQAVAKHLDVLLGAGLVQRTRSGREARFALQEQGLHAARDWLNAVGAQWDATLDRFRAFVEDGV